MSVSVSRSFATRRTSRTPSLFKKHVVVEHADSDRDLLYVFAFKMRADTPALSELAGT